MPYAPTVNDRSGEILAQAKMQDNALRFAQQQQMWQGIGEGINSIGQGLGEYYKKSQENKMTSDYLDAMAGQFSNTMGPDGQTPLMSAEMLEKFSKGSLGAKQGMIVPLMAQYEQNLKNQYLAAQIAGFGQRQAMQNQVPANQVPMAASTAAPATTNLADQAAPAIGSGIKTRPAY